MSCVSTIVASASYLGNTDDHFDSTSVYTPTEAGNYRVSLYFASTSEPGANPALKVSWTDAYGSRQFTTSGFSALSNNAQMSVFLNSAASDAISIEVPAIGGGTVSFDLYVVIEQL